MILFNSSKMNSSDEKQWFYIGLNIFLLTIKFQSYNFSSNKNVQLLIPTKLSSK